MAPEKGPSLATEPIQSWLAAGSAGETKFEACYCSKEQNSVAREHESGEVIKEGNNDGGGSTEG